MLGIVGIIKLVALGVGSLYQVIGTVVFKRAVLFGKPLYAYNIAVVIISGLSGNVSDGSAVSSSATEFIYPL